MKRIVITLAFAACSQPAPAPAPRLITPASCGVPCTTSSQCSDIFSSCRYCGAQGKCTSGIIAAPPQDAGIDASAGTTVTAP